MDVYLQIFYGFGWTHEIFIHILLQWIQMQWYDYSDALASTSEATLKDME